jgi:uridine kinase
MSEMTVIEAYIKFNNQLIILISGLPGSNKNKLSKELASIFKIKYMSLRDFLKKDYNKTVDLSNGSKVIDWDNNDAYNWDKFNSEINKCKSEGIVVAGFAFPTELVKFKVDFHINIKISKKQYIDYRHKYLTDNKDKNKELFDLIDTTTESLIINKLIYPHYLEYTQSSTINKYINTHELDYSGVLDQAFDYIIFVIQKYLETHGTKNNQPKNQYEYKTKQLQNSENNSSHSNDSSSSSSTESYILATVDTNDPYLKYIQ